MRRIGVAGALLAVMCTHAAWAQDLEYTAVTQTKFSAAVGPMMPTGPIQSPAIHTFMKGALVRVEMGQSAFILDAARQQMTALDRTRKTYFTRSMQQLPARDSSRSVAGAVVNVSTAREYGRLNGVAARRTTILVRVPARNAKAPRAKDLVLVSELWTAQDARMAAAYNRAETALEHSGLNPSAMLMVLAGQNPRVSTALELAGKSAARISGFPVRRFLAYGNVAAGSKFVVGMPMDTVMRVLTDVRDVRTTRLPQSLFEVPHDYVQAESRGRN